MMSAPANYEVIINANNQFPRNIRKLVSVVINPPAKLEIKPLDICFAENVWNCLNLSNRLVS